MGHADLTVAAGTRLTGAVRRWLIILAAAAVALGCLSAPVAGGAVGIVARPAVSASCGGTESVSLYAFPGRVVRSVLIPVCARGGITVTFVGDPASCAAAGLCGYAGSDAFSLQGAGDLSLVTVRRRGRASTSVSLFLNNGAVSSVVDRTAGPGEYSSCSDTTAGEPGENVGGFFSAAASGPRVSLGLASSGSAALGTRCAGPLIGDLRDALPTETISLGSLAGGDRLVDLGGTHPFTAHGFTGTVRSTVMLALGRPRGGPVNGGSTPSGFRRVRVRQLTVTDRLVGLSGDVTAAVTTTADPAVCAPLDACALAGAIDVTPQALRGGSLQLFATAPVSRPVAQLRAALDLTRAPPPVPRITVSGGGQTTLSGTVTADLAQNGTCRDTTAISDALLDAAVDRSGRLDLALQTLTTGAADPLRTRCPGPDLGQRSLATAVVPRSVWRRRSFEVALRGASFADGPYRVAIHSTLTVRLRRGHVTSKVYEMPEPDPPSTITR